MLSVCLSVCLSVTFRYGNHIGWNSSKIISRPNSLGPWRGGTPNMGHMGLNRGWVTLSGRKPAISPKRCEIRPRLLLRTNRNSYTRFRSVPKSVTLGDLEGRIQGVTQVFTLALLSQERVKLQTSTLACTFTGSIRTKSR